MNDEIRVLKAVLHILDNNIDLPVLSNMELEIDAEISEFLETHILKTLKDNNLKNAKFIGPQNNIQSICEYLKNDYEYFLHSSKEVANLLFGIMIKNIDIAPADLIYCLFEYNNQPTLGILKLNYKLGFTHFVHQIENGNANTIIKHRTILPSEGQKIDECIIINLENMDISLIEKSFDINGEKDFYLSKLFVKCTTDLSNNEKLKIIDKVTQKINKKYFDEDFDKVAKLKKAVSQSLEEKNAIEVGNLAEEVFERNIEIQNEYLSEIHKAGLTENTIPIPEKLAEKKFGTHKIKTDTGFEINFPSGLYENTEKIEFLNNPDGTISILIKNISKISNR